MTYNKKQMQPIINKYGINPETNKLFIKICEMFDGKANYQNWAVKMIFSQAMTFEELEVVYNWINENPQLISKLEKQNIVAYCNKIGVSTLMKEIEGLNRISFIKNIISHFNTDQKKILTDSILKKDYTPIEAYHDATIKKWFEVFTSFNKKPMNIKNKFYSTCSALRTAEALHKAIQDCLKESYLWSEGKEDLLSFIENNTSDCTVVFNEGPCVIVKVPSFESSKKLCGGGRTGWCLSREESYFRSYVTSHSNRTQYFLFDFSRRESDAFAHIGFTVEGGNGIVEAQTGHNHPMISQYTQNDEKLSIYDVLKKFKVSMGTFMQLPNNLGFKWSMAEVLEMVKKNPQSFAVAYEKDGKLILNVLNKKALNDLLSKTFIKLSAFNDSKNYKTYLLMDFNVPFTNDKSIVAMEYISDKYGDLKLELMFDVFGTDLIGENYLLKVGILEDDFLNREAINPSILLHKYIDENNEAAAIKLIEKERGNIDVNFEFNNRIPVYMAIVNQMSKLFNTIINTDGYDSTITDGYGETLLETLIFLQGSNNVIVSENSVNMLKSMTESILSSSKFDFNVVDPSGDTAINAACEYPSLVWIVKKLVSKKGVNINVVNDMDCSALTNCIRNSNIEALKLLGQRPDLVVREIDRKLAKEFKIDLSEYIKPSESIFTEEASLKTEDVLEYELSMAC